MTPLGVTLPATVEALLSSFRRHFVYLFFPYTQPSTENRFLTLH